MLTLDGIGKVNKNLLESTITIHDEI